MNVSDNTIRAIHELNGKCFAMKKQDGNSCTCYRKAIAYGQEINKFIEADRAHQCTYSQNNPDSTRKHDFTPYLL